MQWDNLPLGSWYFESHASGGHASTHSYSRRPSGARIIDKSGKCSWVLYGSRRIPKSLRRAISYVTLKFNECHRKLESSENAECWDSVVTCFFLDTAPNVVEYIMTIFRLLKSGGIWINFGMFCVVFPLIRCIVPPTTYVFRYRPITVALAAQRFHDLPC
jgi:hypothetical protein